MSFLSRITLRPGAERDPAFARLRLDLIGWHQQIWQLFQAPPGTERDFLFHIEDHERPRALALSARPPRIDDRWWQVESKPYAPDLAVGDRLSFRLRANPTIKRDGKRHDVVMDALQAAKARGEGTPHRPTVIAEVGPAWLAARADTHGFSLTSALADRYEDHRARRRDGKPLTVSTLDFEGLLEVADVERFRQTLHHGLGHAKGFGCGLLLIRRI
jgi:CRISPR system Cascade subunit CasE